MGYGYFYHTNDPDAVYAYPHYSDETFRNGELIYGVDKGAQGEYSDRLWQWDAAAGERASAAVADLSAHTARRAEAWLSAYYGKPVRLNGIIGGFNWATGYDYYFYRFDFVG